MENLRIVEAQQNIVFGPHMQEAPGISALVFAVAGMGGAAVQTSSNSDAAEDVNLYSFEIDGVKYAGCTRKATFENGDVVELVYEPKTKGNEVLAVRRPATRSIWLYPFMSRGTVAAKWFGFNVWWQWSAGVSLFLVLLFSFFGLVTPSFKFDFYFAQMLSFGAIGLTFVLLAFFGILFAPKYLRFARAADEVFATFGYKEPEKVDLGKTSKAHRKANNIVWTIANNLELWY